MGTKLVVGPGGPQYVPTTPEEDAQAAIDAQDAQAVQQAAQSEATRKGGLASDADVIDLLNRAKTATNLQISNFIAPIFPNAAQAKVVAALIKVVALKL